MGYADENVPGLTPPLPLKVPKVFKYKDLSLDFGIQIIAPILVQPLFCDAGAVAAKCSGSFRKPLRRFWLRQNDDGEGPWEQQREMMSSVLSG